MFGPKPGSYCSLIKIPIINFIFLLPSKDSDKSSLFYSLWFPNLCLYTFSSLCQEQSSALCSQKIFSYSLSQRSASHGPWITSSPPLAFVNKVFLEPSHAHLFMCYLWPPLYYSTSKVEYLQQRSCGSQNLTYLLCGLWPRTFAHHCSNPPAQDNPLLATLLGRLRQSDFSGQSTSPVPHITLP